MVVVVMMMMLMMMRRRWWRWWCSTVKIEGEEEEEEEDEEAVFTCESITEGGRGGDYSQVKLLRGKPNSLSRAPVGGGGGG